MAKQNNIIIITYYRKNNKDMAVIINNSGEKILERAKTLPDKRIKLNLPLMVKCNKMVIGYFLCMEILKGVRDFKKISMKINFIVHPIGVGMFSDEQFYEWINEVKKIARIHKTIIMGTSHADGSYKNCGVSVHITYCIDSSG